MEQFDFDANPSINPATIHTLAAYDQLLTRADTPSGPAADPTAPQPAHEPETQSGEASP